MKKLLIVCMATVSMGVMLPPAHRLAIQTISTNSSLYLTSMSIIQTTQYFDYHMMRDSVYSNLTLINRTNYIPPRGTNVFVIYDGEGTIQTATNANGPWTTTIVDWTNMFSWPITDNSRFFRLPAIPSSNPNNQTIVTN